MSLTTSTVTPLIVRTSENFNHQHQNVLINEPYYAYQQPRTTYSSYFKRAKTQYRYTVEQEGKSYRFCQWCRYWCTRKCPIFDFCDKVISCPLLFYILSGLFLLFLLIAILTLFGLHPNINSARRYYGIIFTLSIVNTTKYIFNLDKIIPDYVTIINPDGSTSYEKNYYYQQPTIIRRTYAKPKRSKYRYALEQEGKTYRYCQWCRYWCTRKCPIFDFCDQVISCPLLFYILSGLFLLFLLIAILTLFGLHPNINSARRYYGIISTLSIRNRTTYVYGADALCNKVGTISNCFSITTSTGVSYVATTFVLNQTASLHTYSCLSFILHYFCLIIYLIFCTNDIHLI